jgi:glucoamylase
MEVLRPQGNAPGADWSCATWAPATKDAVGTSQGRSRLWFTIAQGIITEVYHPRPDIPQLKDLGFIVAGPKGFWVEVRRLGEYSVAWADDAIPAITVTHTHARFTLNLRICGDPERDVLLIQHALDGDPTLQLFMLAAPRIGENAADNRAWAEDWEGRPVLCAEQGPWGMAIAAIDRDGNPGLLQRSVGIVGASDGWQDFHRNGSMCWHYAEAGPGEVALTAQLAKSGTLALGICTSREAAATLALESLANGFDAAWESYCSGWQEWLDAVRWPRGLERALDRDQHLLMWRSAAVIKCHADRTFPGAFVASLSIPWGESSASRGGYHLVWARDLVETAGALVALGCIEDARRVLIYLIATQQADGHWLQNQWLGGKPFWQGIQLDETAFPVLLASALAERGVLGTIRVEDMVRRALAFIAREGPVTAQDRWEEDTGINTFTVAVAIAALVEGSRFLSGREAECALMLADAWNSRIEDWTWSQDTALAREIGVPGYYIRTAPADVLIHEGPKHERMLIKNCAQNTDPFADERVAIDCLQLARYGLRSVEDPTMSASIAAIDHLLKTDTPNGPVWHRYTGDGYGEHPDGAPFDGWGCGRGWPLLTGERGHMAVLAGSDGRPYLEAMAKMTGKGGLLPEQVWDSDPLPARGLYPGEPSGSAMPLVWAHAEFIKLALTIAAGAPVDRPARTWARYGGKRPRLDFVLWQPRQRPGQMSAGQQLRVLLPEPGRIHWCANGWKNPSDVDTEDWGFGHLAPLPVEPFPAGTRVDFTIYWPARAAWHGEDFQITVV